MRSLAPDHTPVSKRIYARRNWLFQYDCTNAVDCTRVFMLAVSKTLAHRRETAPTSPSTVTTYARLRVVLTVRKGYAEALPLGSLLVRKTRGVSPTSPVTEDPTVTKGNTQQ